VKNVYPESCPEIDSGSAFISGSQEVIASIAKQTFSSAQVTAVTDEIRSKVKVRPWHPRNQTN